MRIGHAGRWTLALALVAGTVGCDSGTTGVEPTETALVRVVPEGGTALAAYDASVELRFDGALHDHAMDYVAVHEGDVTGPEVHGMWMMEEGGTVMRFTPDQAWHEDGHYTVHVGGGMEDVHGHGVDLETHGPSMGGMWATDSMMEGGMHGGGMNGGHDHVGDGWDHPSNGSHGMTFGFTTP